MEAVLSKTATPSSRLPRRLDVPAISAWVLALALVLYLGFDGGGYSLSSHGQVGIVVWWLVVIGAAWGLLPVSQPGRAAIWTVGLLGAFTLWTAIGITWSISSGRSFQDLALINCYLGILVLAIAIHRERADAVRHTTAAVASAIVVVALLALASRLWPNAFPAAQTTSKFLLGTQSRLSWPLNYWNALGTLMALGLPLLLGLATSSRTLLMRGAAAAAIPVLALCGALTLSRGSLIEAAIAVLVFFALVGDRIPKLATALVATAGSAAAIEAGLSRHAVQQGFNNAAEHNEVAAVVVSLVLVCIGVGIAQIGVSLLERHGRLPRVLTVSPRRARFLTLGAVVAIVVIALAAGAPHRIDHAWNNFKSPISSAAANSASRFGSASGTGRYQWWVAAIHSAESHPLTGSGPGTYQLDWLPRATNGTYVVNAHSLYIETYAELGAIGLALLVAFLVTALVLLVRNALRATYENRTRAAAIAAVLAAFMVSAAFDWVWQMPVLVAAVLVLLGASLAPNDRKDETLEDLAPPMRPTPDGQPAWVTYAKSREELAGRGHARSGLLTQVVLVVVGLVCVVSTAYPLATNSAIINSQTAVNENNLILALKDARTAAGLESGSGPAQLQLALVLEQLNDYPAAVAAAKHAVAVDPDNWSNWLVLSRLQSERGNTGASVAAYERARSLNPQSNLFQTQT